MVTENKDECECDGDWISQDDDTSDMLDYYYDKYHELKNEGNRFHQIDPSDITRDIYRNHDLFNNCELMMYAFFDGIHFLEFYTSDKIYLLAREQYDDEITTLLLSVR